MPLAACGGAWHCVEQACWWLGGACSGCIFSCSRNTRAIPLESLTTPSSPSTPPANPRSYYDAEIGALLQRHTRKRSSGVGIDLRAGTLPLSVPSPGDPARAGLHVSELTWSIKADHEWLIRAAPQRNKQPAFGFLLQEAGRWVPGEGALGQAVANTVGGMCACRARCAARGSTPAQPPPALASPPTPACPSPIPLPPLPPRRLGKLHVEVAKALGVEEGANFTRLKQGESVPTPDGRVVHSAQCVGPPKRGRRVAIVGACADSSGFAQAVAAPRPGDIILGLEDSSPGAAEVAISAAAAAAEDPICDLLVHALAFPPGAPAGGVRSAAGVAGATAAALSAKELVLWQHQAAFLDAPEGRDPGFPAEALEAARAAMGSDLVSLAGCYWCYQPEREEEANVGERLLREALQALQGSDNEG